MHLCVQGMCAESQAADDGKPAVARRAGTESSSRVGQPRAAARSAAVAAGHDEKQAV